MRSTYLAHRTVVNDHAAIDGRSAIEINTPGNPTLSVTLWVDAQTYLPLRMLKLDSGSTNNPETRKVHDYQFLPATPANLAALTPHRPEWLYQGIQLNAPLSCKRDRFRTASAAIPRCAGSMIPRRVVALATGIVLITACMVTISVRGNYPQTGFVQIMLWGGIVVSSAVAGYTAGWIYAQTKDEASASRVVTSMVIGLVCGGIVALMLYGLAAVVVLALIANA